MKNQFARYCLTILLLFIVLLCGCSNDSSCFRTKKIFYVSPDGSDTNPGTLNAPFGTFEKARISVREAMAEGETDISVYFRGGEYKIDKPIYFDHLDSGRQNGCVTYANYRGEKPIFSGGVAITQWQHHSGKIYKAFVGGDWSFRQIYVNNKKAVRAREPNTGELYTLPKEKEFDGFDIEAGLLDLVENPENVEISVFNLWMNKRLRIVNTYKSGNYVRVVINPIEWAALLNGPQADRSYAGREYWFENAYEFIDSPGEWYFEKSCGMLYYWPREGENLSQSQVIVPLTEQIVVLSGSIDYPVENLFFSGLEFNYTNWTRPSEYGFVDVYSNTLVPIPANDKFDPQYRHNQRKDRIPAAFHAYSSNRICIKDCVFRHLGGTGLTFDDGGVGNQILGNVFIDISGSGIEIGNDSHRPRDKRMIPKETSIRNNYIEDIANDYRGGLGINVFYADTLLIEHNHINNVPYSGIAAGWGWALTETFEENRNFSIRSNRVDNYGRELTDCGGIYTPNPVYGSNVIEENYIKGNDRSLTAKYIIMGIYHDGCSSNWKTQNNVIENVHNWWIGGASFTSQVKSNISVNNNYTTFLQDRITVVVPEGSVEIEPANNRNIVIKDTMVCEDACWPDSACEIIQKSGLEEEWEYIMYK